MNYLDIMQNSIDYIEENLKSELTADELSKNAGFSLFHYYHLFQNVVGIPLMQYISKRKLYNAIYEISCGQKITDTALIYGFETHAGFFKAFKREFSCSPTEYLKKHHRIVKPYKINLYEEEYIMVTDKKLKEVLTHWKLKEPIEIKNLYYEASGNKSDHVWIINDNFILKISTNIQNLKHHIALSKALRKAGLETTVPVPTTDKNDYFMDDQLYFCLTNKIKGECIKTSEMYDGDYKAKARYLGEIIGQLHLILRKEDRELICNEPNLYENTKNWAIPEIKKYMTLPNAFYDDYLENFKMLYVKLPKHIIHRDPNPGNIIMKDGRLIGFIDFELSERNIRIFDPCYASVSILSESFNEKDKDKLEKWLAIFQNIISGYDSVCKLSDDEKQAIPYAIYSIQMMCVAAFNNLDKFKELSKINQKMLFWLIDNSEIFTI